MSHVHLLAIAAHRDDVELTCAGTLLRAADQGYRTAILDLTQGETGTRGSAALRGLEAEAAAKILGVAERRNAALPDAHLANTDAMRRVLVDRPHKILYSLAYREDPVKPTFVVDISDQFARKMAAIRCYASQFDGATNAGEIFPTGQDLYSLIEIQCAHYGSLIRTRYGEPFFTHETVRVDDVVAIEVQSM